ncbi:hypothetical protein EV196_1216 [Mariniflexile fucanivorans]|uniref:Uncharacterized protein n=1 Tax=Mariniflexile fucanivorans TaxID=264023 RepID=A0A4R1R8T3_9FLAO|nr:hypothetical protein [Mariniflexile fucanivorans]TCL61970.1 hypothetical protein EV196_1216 [Mariniflexile fucanivorans]
MKHILLFVVLIIFNNCAKNDCIQGINNLPKYGKIKKCAEQITLDNEFIKGCDTIYPNRKIAAIHYIDLAWGYFYNNQIDLSMKRFNQAWLLDKNNADIYWGYGNLMGKKGEFEESLKYFEESIQINSQNAKVWESKAISHGQLFFKTKEKKSLNELIECLKISLKIDPNNARAYGQLAGAYGQIKEKDSLEKYIKLTDQIDSTFVHPEVRKLMNQ